MRGRMEDKCMIIIGAGVAGLAAGCYAQMNGYRTRIFEQHTVPGGLCTGWKRGGYTFDGCLHWLVGTAEGKQVNDVWQELGALEGKRIFDFDTFYTYTSADGSKTFHCYNDLDRLEAEMLRLSPADRPAIAEVMEAARASATFFDALEGLQTGGLVQKLASLPKLAGFSSFTRKWEHVTVRQLGERFSDPFLRKALTYFPDKVAALVFILTLVWLAQKNAGVPEGGSLEFARSIERRYRSLGGEMSYGARVARILVESDRAVGVRLQDGSEHRADWVISAADGRTTLYNMLEERFLSPEAERPYREHWETFSSVVQVSFGVNMDLRDAAQQRVWELEKPVRLGDDSLSALPLRHFSYDPSMAPAGKSVAIVLYDSNIEPWRALLRQGREFYEARKEEVRRMVVDLVEERVPGFREAIEVSDVATPITLERYTSNWNGSMEGWLPLPGRIDLRGRDVLPRSLPGLKGFYMTGQWVYPGGGVPVAMDARKVIQSICKEDGRGFRALRPNSK